MSWIPLPLFRFSVCGDQIDYDHYDIYCLNSQLQIFVNSNYGPEYLMNYSSKSLDKTKRQLGMVLTKGGVPVEGIRTKLLKDRADHIIEKYRRHALLFSASNFPTFPPVWLNRIVRNYEFGQDEVIFTNAAVLIKLSVDYDKKIIAKQNELLVFFRDMWNKKLAFSSYKPYPLDWGVKRLTNNQQMLDLYEDPPDLEDGSMVERLNLPIDRQAKFFIVSAILKHDRMRTMIGDSLTFESYNFLDRVMILDEVKNAKTIAKKTKGMVKTVAFPELAQATEFFDEILAKVKYYCDDQIIYWNDLTAKYTIDCLIIDMPKYTRLKELYKRFEE